MDKGDIGKPFFDMVRHFIAFHVFALKQGNLLTCHCIAKPFEQIRTVEWNLNGESG